jgi:hypothetical protein
MQQQSKYRNSLLCKEIQHRTFEPKLELTMIIALQTATNYQPGWNITQELPF